MADATRTSKRPRTVNPEGAEHTALVAVPAAASDAPPPRSSLPSPSLLLEGGHTALVLGLAFSHDGSTLATCSKDKTVSLWDYRGGCANTLSLRGHKNAVLRVAWLAAGAGQLATASADRTCAVWDAPSGARLRTLTGHERIVNDVAAGAAREAGSHALASASDDGSVLLWDARARRAAGAVPGRAPLLACAYGADAHTLYCAGVEGVVRAYDLRGGSSGGSGSGSGSGGQLLPVLTLEDGGGGVSSLAASPNGFQLLALGFDGVARTYDVQAFCAAPSRCTGALGAARAPGAGAGAGAGGLFDSGLLRASWSPCGQRVCVGGSDKVARVYEAASGQLLAELPGHTGAVVEGAWHPEEPVLATAGDRTVFIGELSR